MKVNTRNASAKIKKTVGESYNKTKESVSSFLARSNFIIVSVIALAFALVGVFLAVIGFNPDYDSTVTYTNSSNIDYKVCLKPNKFFETQCPKADTYITNLIDHLDLGFNYNLSLDRTVDIEYTYNFVATISASKTKNMGAGTGGEYWSKTYQLTEPKTIRIEDTSSLNISQNVKVNYDEYNRILADFKSQFSLAATGNLKIAMQFDGTVFSKELSDPITLEYEEINLNIPLTEQSVEASITGTNSDPHQHTVTNHILGDNFGYGLLRVLAIILIIIAVLLAVLAVRKYREQQSSRRFEITVKRLLNTYDSVIVEVDKQPKLSGINVLTVNDFDELLDVYNSIHMPISYYRDAIGAHFVIISEHMAWRYSILLRDFKKKK